MTFNDSVKKLVTAIVTQQTCKQKVPVSHFLYFNTLKVIEQLCLKMGFRNRNKNPMKFRFASNFLYTYTNNLKR